MRAKSVVAEVTSGSAVTGVDGAAVATEAREADAPREIEASRLGLLLCRRRCERAAV
ncbi:MAG: hypothetical protein AABY85_08755 [Gemmatimonadota bacterium]